tara:strand:+ start:329 stop:2071 length:1743 start_codon:yes stop_codon:yes gene_type:complete
MIYIKDHKQTEIFDPWSFLSPKRRYLLAQSWAGLFKEEILCEFSIRKLAPFFTDGFGRPIKELHTVLGVLILQQTHDLTDEETVNQLAFNIQWHYALNIPEESDSAKYMCLKTLWNMCSIVVGNGLETILFESINSKLATVFKVDTDKQRIDSMHIKSNMRRLGRIGIFTKTIHKFLVNLKRGHKEQFSTVTQATIDKYLPEKALDCFSMVKPSESKKNLASIACDLFDLVQQFKDYSEVASMHSYKLLERVLKEQCNLHVSGDKTLVEVKNPKEIPSDSLQNPSDPDATYDGHKGQGYQIQIMETFCKDKEIKDETLNLITYVDVEPAHESDANALIPGVESVNDRNLAPEEVLGDSLYGSDENCETALKEFDVEVVALTMGSSNKGSIHLSDFGTPDKGEIISCPEGHAPVMRKKKKTRNTLSFDIDKCSNCPSRKNCPVKQGKKYYYLRYTDKEMRIAKRRAYEQTEEFKDRYRWHAGIEATMSEIARKTGVKQLRVRGLNVVRFCATLKAIGVNIFRATAARMAQNQDKSDHGECSSNLNHAIFIIKEHFMMTLSHLKKIYSLYFGSSEHKLKIAA